MLGYAMESAQGEWQSVLPYDESSGLIAELVGHLAPLLMQLNIWRRGLAQERPLEEWLPVCRDMLNAFFLPDAETEAAMTLIEQLAGDYRRRFRCAVWRRGAAVTIA
ncbi:hypothetical protein ACLK10_15580 [Escherichia coli]